jgi:transposase-like protein
MAKKGQEYKNYSAEYKLNVIMAMQEHRLGYVETARKYDIPNYRVIQRWERIFLEEGAEGLMKERRGRACAASGTKKGRPPKLDPKVEEDLIAENQRLRMEIEYLKKLDALVREREERENARKQK